MSRPDRTPAHRSAADPTALAWQQHLLDGGTTPWREFLDTGAATDVPGSPGTRPAALAGAQNLELLRRLNLAGRPGRQLAEQVLAASLPGRGRPDLPLVGTGEPRWGTRPVDPSDLAPAELLRVAVGLLADRAAHQPLPVQATRRPRRFARQFELVGDPWQVADLLDALRADGRLPGGRAAHHLVLAAPLDQLFVSLWTRRAHGDGVRGWNAWVESWVRRNELPPRIDVATLAETARDTVGADRTHLVLDPAALPSLLGTRTRLPELALPAPLPGAGASDLARRVATAMRVRVAGRERRERAWRLLHERSRGSGGEPPVAFSPRHQDWLLEQAELLQRRLRRGGHRVHGDLDRLLPTGRTGPEVPAARAARAALDRAVGMLLGGTDPARGPAPDRGGRHNQPHQNPGDQPRQHSEVEQ